MDGTRREFLKLAGLSALGVAGASSLGLTSGEGSAASAPTAPAGRPRFARAGAEPLTAKRWAMVIDVAKLERHQSWGRCVEACRQAHNIPTFTSAKDEVKWIWPEAICRALPDLEHRYLPERLRHQDVLVLCNHCDDPPCVRVCPTGATWRRERDGLVMMDWHRCIGCRYCMVACPYGSRSFNWRDPRPHLGELNPDFPTRRRGVVEKCNFCEERLARGLAPACVEACEHGELTFGDLEDPDSEVRRLLGERLALRRKPGLGTGPEVYYIV